MLLVHKQWKTTKKKKKEKFLRINDCKKKWQKLNSISNTDNNYICGSGNSGSEAAAIAVAAVAMIETATALIKWKHKLMTQIFIHLSVTATFVSFGCCNSKTHHKNSVTFSKVKKKSKFYMFLFSYFLFLFTCAHPHTFLCHRFKNNNNNYHFVSVFGDC